MQEAAVRFYSLGYSDWKTYKMAILFVIANVLFPQLCHLIGTGEVWLPIYFFTLVGAYKYGWKVGVLTAILSPLTSHILFGMPTAAILPLLMGKSVALALVAGMVSSYYQRLTFPIWVMVVLGGWLLCGVFDWVMRGDIELACHTQLVGVPGVILQLVGGYFAVEYLSRK